MLHFLGIRVEQAHIDKLHGSVTHSGTGHHTYLLRPAHSFALRRHRAFVHGRMCDGHGHNGAQIVIGRNAADVGGELLLGHCLALGQCNLPWELKRHHLTTR